MPKNLQIELSKEKTAEKLVVTAVETQNPDPEMDGQRRALDVCFHTMWNMLCGMGFCPTLNNTSNGQHSIMLHYTGLTDLMKAQAETVLWNSVIAMCRREYIGFTVKGAKKGEYDLQRWNVA